MIPIVRSIPLQNERTINDIDQWMLQRGYIEDERLPIIESWGEVKLYGHAIKEFAQSFRQSFIMIEADIAIDLYDVLFAYEAIMRNPNDVHVGIYHLHPGTSGLPFSVIAHRYRKPDKQLAWISEDSFRTFADSIGFGMVYFPWPILHRAIGDGIFDKPENSPHIDTAFSEWCEANRHPMRLMWEVRAKHLNFTWPSVLDQNT